MSTEGVDTPQVQVKFQNENIADAEKGKAKKTPRRIIYFQDGDQLEEYSTEEEDDDLDKVDVAVQRMASMDWKSLPWGSYLFSIGLFGFLRAFKGLEYAGEILSYKLGITAPKYQSELNEAARMEIEEEEERKRSERDDASWSNAITENTAPKLTSATSSLGTPFCPHLLNNPLSSPLASSTPTH